MLIFWWNSCIAKLHTLHLPFRFYRHKTVRKSPVGVRTSVKSIRHNNGRFFIPFWHTFLISAKVYFYGRSNQTESKGILEQKKKIPPILRCVRFFQSQSILFTCTAEKRLKGAYKQKYPFYAISGRFPHGFGAFTNLSGILTLDRGMGKGLK